MFFKYSAIDWFIFGAQLNELFVGSGRQRLTEPMKKKKYYYNHSGSCSSYLWRLKGNQISLISHLNKCDNVKFQLPVSPESVAYMTKMVSVWSPVVPLVLYVFDNSKFPYGTSILCCTINSFCLIFPYNVNDIVFGASLD